ncbi:MAG: hypothetical protein U5J78_01130 [Parasphingorhabdus sp.]|nr:hypothetical protein [Parasphingorhabdus sp.]
MHHRRSATDRLRENVAEARHFDEQSLYQQFCDELAIDEEGWRAIGIDAAAMVATLRSAGKSPLIDQFLNEYSLSSDEGVAMMRLAEALSRANDPYTADALIADKMMGKDWASHRGGNRSTPINLAARAFQLTDSWLGWSDRNARNPMARAGNAIVRQTSRLALGALSSQFVFANDIDGALRRAAKYAPARLRLFIRYAGGGRTDPRRCCALFCRLSASA